MFNINKEIMTYNLFFLTVCICFGGVYSGIQWASSAIDGSAILGRGSDNRNMTKNRISEANLPLLYSKTSDKGYYVENILQANLYEAMYYCKYHGMELVSINSKDEEDSVLEILKDLEIDTEMYFLTSARSMVTDRFGPPQRTWVWLSSGKPMKYKHWYPEPSGSDSECCMKLRFNKNDRVTSQQPHYSLGWQAHNCDHQIYFICQTI